jgi:hypothetical protein
LQESGQEVQQAAQNVVEGGPLGANIGKAGSGLLHGLLAQVPFIGTPTEQAGIDVANKNYAGAAGGLTGVAAQVLAPKIVEAGGDALAAGKSAATKTTSALRDAFVEPKPTSPCRKFLSRYQDPWGWILRLMTLQSAKLAVRTLVQMRGKLSAMLLARLSQRL